MALYMLFDISIFQLQVLGTGSERLSTLSQQNTVFYVGVPLKVKKVGTSKFIQQGRRMRYAT